MIKRTFTILMATLVCITVFGQNLTPSDADSKISFVIKNLGINVNGTLKGLKGTMAFDPKNLAKSAFDVTVDVNTINTDNTKRDNHLKKDDFFDADQYPTIRIKTTKIQAKSGTVYFAKAVLTMHGVSKDIQFDFIAKPTTTGYTFTGGFPLNRRDYGVGGNSLTMSDNVSVQLNVVGKK